MRAAARHTGAYRDLPQIRPTLVLSGHQPGLFHPGVWFKNFLLATVSDNLPATGINVNIDNDICESTRIRVPGGSRHDPLIRRIGFDQGGRIVPYEERELRDVAMLRSFADRIKRSVAAFVGDPLVGQLQPFLNEASLRSRNLGQVLVEARHRLEAAHGLNTLEVPLSSICQGSSFTGFISEVLNRLEEFTAAYNQAIEDYRKARGIHAPNRPVPQLRTCDEYQESPFWIWKRGMPIRRRLFVRVCEHELELSDLQQVRLRLPRRDLIQAIIDRQTQYAIRPRALVTTLYLRMILSDLFIHGIGGAVYDRITDRIVEDFFGIVMPEFVTATATMKLVPFAREVTGKEVGYYRHRLRELYYHPESHIDHPDSIERALVANKRELLDELPHPAGKAAWHRRLERVNLRLREHTTNQARLLQQQLAEAESALQRQRLLGSREFSYCLYPARLWCASAPHLHRCGAALHQGFSRHRQRAL